VTDTGGRNVAIGMCETLGVDEVVFGVVSEGMVDVMWAMEVTNISVITGIGHNYEMTRGKVDVGSTEPDGADAGVGTRFGGIEMGISYIN
ncbi:hypothetical protein KI387_036992, partial [Taxus chinensis]